MQCKFCGQLIDEKFGCCTHCGKWACEDDMDSRGKMSGFGIAVLSVLFPLVGVILHLVWKKKQDYKRADLAGKGALVGCAVMMVLSIVFCAWVFVIDNVQNDFQASVDELFREETVEELLENNVDIVFGKFSVDNDAYIFNTSLEVTVTNKAAAMKSYRITIEAVKSDGTRIGTDTVYAYELNAGQKVELTAFDYVPSDKLDLYKNAEFHVLKISKY